MEHTESGEIRIGEPGQQCANLSLRGAQVAESKERKGGAGGAVVDPHTEALDSISCERWVWSWEWERGSIGVWKVGHEYLMAGELVLCISGYLSLFYSYAMAGYQVAG